MLFKTKYIKLYYYDYTKNTIYVENRAWLRVSKNKKTKIVNNLYFDACKRIRWKRSRAAGSLVNCARLFTCRFSVLIYQENIYATRRKQTYNSATRRADDEWKIKTKMSERKNGRGIEWYVITTRTAADTRMLEQTDGRLRLCRVMLRGRHWKFSRKRI